MFGNFCVAKDCDRIIFRHRRRRVGVNRWHVGPQSVIPGLRQREYWHPIRRNCMFRDAGSCPQNAHVRLAAGYMTKTIGMMAECGE